MYYPLVVLAAISVVTAHTPLPSDLSEELYCIGCKATVNELHKVLKHHISEKMEKRVHDALGRVCHEDYFKTYEYSTKKLVLACQHLIENHQDDLVPLLKDHFTKKNRRGETYLYIAHIVCNKETFACGGYTEEEHDPSKGKIVYNDDTDDFDIHFGDNVKMMKPVRESQSRDEL